jgi:SAM-dependent methyltransferase
MERFKPPPVRAPVAGPLLFLARCLVDLQLLTIARFLKPALRSLPPGNVLDVGCGEAPWAEYLPPACTLTKLDVGHSADFGMAARPDIIRFDGAAIPFSDAVFAATLCVEVLEHARCPEKLLAEISRVLVPGGRLFLTVPWSARAHHLPYDYHRFTRERLKEMLEAAGFAGIEIRERGEELPVLAAKTVVILVQVLAEARPGALWRTLPLLMFFVPLAAVLLPLAHVVLWLRPGRGEDPLGYSVTAVRPDN